MVYSLGNPWNMIPHSLLWAAFAHLARAAHDRRECTSVAKQLSPVALQVTNLLPQRYKDSRAPPEVHRALSGWCFSIAYGGFRPPMRGVLGDKPIRGSSIRDIIRVTRESFARRPGQDLGPAKRPPKILFQKSAEAISANESRREGVVTTKR